MSWLRPAALVPAGLAVTGIVWDLQVHAGPVHNMPLGYPAHLLVLGSSGGLVALAVQGHRKLVLGWSTAAGMLIGCLAITWLTAVDQPPAPPAAGTAAQVAAADELFSQTRQDTAKYRDIAAAYADGYVNANTPDAPVQHLVNPAYLDDGRVLDPERPESLVYSGISVRPVLIGVMYILAPGEQAPDRAGPLTRWHDHADLCFTPNGGVTGQVGPRGCPAGSALAEARPMLHVWLVDNPAGRFAADVPPLVLLEHLFG